MNPVIRALVLALAFAAMSGRLVQAQQTVGLFINEAPAPGYTLLSPVGTENSHLISNNGLLVRSWIGTARPGLMAYFTAAGTLMRSSKIAGGAPGTFPIGGSGGRVEEYGWDGNLIWEFEYATNDHRAHHDIEVMPNGNVLMIAWEMMSELDAIAEGKNPADVTGVVYLDTIIEVQPTPPTGGTIVWEWKARDHLIQDFDPTKNNFGVVADHPELIDFNFSTLRDWSHFNAVDYSPSLDQVLVSVHSFHEIWVIDHSTTTAEAAGHTGGNSGQGGDLLYRWGNPDAYRRGGATDRKLFGQHDAQWIDPGRPGAGHLLVFNNRQTGPAGSFSSVDEIEPPVDVNGNYTLTAGQAYGPVGPSWIYQASPPQSLYSPGTSGASRLANGNTLITEGGSGRIFEVEPDGTVTWEYQNPDTGNGLLNQGDSVDSSGVFKARRYPPDFPGFDSPALIEGDPVEGFSRPAPPDDGSLRATRLAVDGSQLEVSWSDGGCPSFEYHVLFGDLANVATSSFDGALCDVGISGTAVWSNVPTGSQFFVVVGTDFTGVYESGWGDAFDGTPRGNGVASFNCGTTTKILNPQCP